MGQGNPNISPELENLSDDEIDSLISQIQSGGTPDLSMLGEKVVQEQHPDISALDRLKIKNFGGSTQGTIRYLNEKGLEATERGGQIVARKPGEKEWKVLDPEGWKANLNPVEALKDLGDIGYDITQGAVQTIGSAAAGLAGGAASGGIGAVPSAMAAGAGIGAAGEGLRQAIGNALNVADGADYANIAIQGALGGLTPAVFGTGASKAAQQAYLSGRGAIPSVLGAKALGSGAPTKDATRSILGKISGYVPEETAITPSMREAATQEFANTQKGWLSDLGTKTLAKTSGIDYETLKLANDPVTDELRKQMTDFGVNLDPKKAYTMLELVDEVGKQDIGSVGDAALTAVQDAIAKRKEALSQKYTEALTKSGKMVDMSSARKALEDTLEKYRRALEAGGPESLNTDISETIDVIKKLMSPPEAEAGTAAVELVDQYGNKLSKEAMKARTGARAFEQGAKGPTQPYYLPADVAMLVKNKLSDLAEYSKSPMAVDKMSTWAKTHRKDLIYAERSIDNQIETALKEAGEAGLSADYRKNRELFRSLYPKFKDAPTAVKTLKTLNNKANTPLRNVLKRFDVEERKNIGELSRFVSLWDAMYQPSWDAISSKGATSTSRTIKTGALGSALGYGLGLASGIPGISPIAAAVAGAGGTMASSPAATRGYLSASQALNKLPIAGSVKQYMENQMGKTPYVGGVPGTAWNLLLQQRGER